MIARAAALLLAAGCAYLPTAPAPSPQEGEWAQAREANTRQAKLYDGLTTRAFASATWDAPSVRTARVARVAEWKKLTPEERAALDAGERTAAELYEEFTVSLFTPDQDDNDLDARVSIWRIALVLPDGGEVRPLQVDVERADALLRSLYPYVGDFDTVYRLRFRRIGPPLGADPFVLRLAGPRGTMDFPFGG